MNLQNVLWLLLGVCIGAEIMGLVMKYRYDTVAKEIRSMRERIFDLLETNGRLIENWQKSVDLNSELLEEVTKEN